MKKFLFCLVFGLLSTSSMAQQQFEPIADFDHDGRSLFLQDPYLYVSELEGLRIYDISQGIPSLVGRLDTDGALTATGVSGNIAILGLDNGSDPNLLIVDISDKTSPQVLHNLQTSPDDPDQEISFIYPKGNFFLIGLLQDGLISTQLEADNRLTIVDSMSIDGFITDVHAFGDLLYISADWTLNFVDYADPTNMQSLGSYENRDYFNGIDALGNLLVAAEGLEGLSLFDISNMDSPEFLRFFRISVFNNEASDVAISGNLVYISTFFRPSGNVTEPERPGGITVVDIEDRENPVVETSFRAIREVLKLVVHNGYVYALGDNKLYVFQEAVRQGTPTPTFTPSPTLTPTPTNTPPALVTATPRPGEETPIPQATFTPTPTLAPEVTPSNTPEAQASPTPSSGGELSSIFTVDFDGPFLSDEPFAAQLPFAGDYTIGDVAISQIPTDNAFEGATNGQGLLVRVNPGQAVTLFAPQGATIDPNTPAILRVNVRSSGSGASIAMAALDGTFDGSIMTNVPTDSAIFADGYKRFSMVYNPPNNSIAPLLQVVSTGEEQVTVYFDNFEIIPLPAGSVIPVEMLGVGATAP